MPDDYDFDPDLDDIDFAQEESEIEPVFDPDIDPEEFDEFHD